MKYHLIIRPEADADIEESYNWYEDQSIGLGNEFLRILDATLISIERNPLAHPLVYKNIRRAVIRRFPHAFFYVLKENRVLITACVHHKRDQKSWQLRS